MQALQFLSLMLLSLFALVSSEPSRLMHRDEPTCKCMSPTGCPGQCQGTNETGYSCFNYCGNNVSLPCRACSDGASNCIVDSSASDGCFTVEFWVQSWWEDRDDYFWWLDWRWFLSGAFCVAGRVKMMSQLFEELTIIYANTKCSINTSHHS